MSVSHSDKAEQQDDGLNPIVFYGSALGIVLFSRHGVQPPFS